MRLASSVISNFLTGCQTKSNHSTAPAKPAPPFTTHHNQQRKARRPDIHVAFPGNRSRCPGHAAIRRGGRAVAQRYVHRIEKAPETSNSSSPTSNRNSPAMLPAFSGRTRTPTMSPHDVAGNNPTVVTGSWPTKRRWTYTQVRSLSRSTRSSFAAIAVAWLVTRLSTPRSPSTLPPADGPCLSSAMIWIDTGLAPG